MTFKEQFNMDYPDHINKDIPLFGCPFDYGYEASRPCKDHTQRNLRHCRECWNREMPGTKEKPRILDSGELTTFEGGAVRSDFNVDGTRKGRCDLLPLSVVYDHLKIHGGDSGKILEYIGAFQKHGDTNFLHEALRRFVVMHNEWRTAYDMFLDVAKHYEEGAEKYGEDNWRKGLPVKNYVSSAVRHYLKWLRGDKDEPHDRAFVWNLLCCIWEVDYSPRAKTKEAPVAEEAVDPESNSGRFYICNRKPCEVCQSDCHHTDDIRHAKNFEQVSGLSYLYAEKETDVEQTP